ncbi:MAG: protein-glutamate O-methyltransferase CheR [Actinomycetota bacterium]|nr:protein-glutamate O-methyltransferase CheR [Actinomycetota bacterium]
MSDPGSDRANNAASINPLDGTFLRQLLREKAAIEVDERRDYLLTARLAPIAAEFQLDDLAELVRRLRLGDQRIEDAVIDAMTTNETSFFRDPTFYSDMVSTVLPALIERVTTGHPLTIWSAACSSGQEIYSIAMTIDQHFPQLLQSQAVRFLATDISPTMVERCHQGRYTEQEVTRGVDPEQRARYFDRDGDGYIVRRSLRDVVFTRQVNLVHPFGMVPKCDLILLRNVLIYFRDDVRTSILERMRRSVLKSDGLLILGASETLVNIDVGYDTVHLPLGVAYTPVSPPR